VVEALTKAGRKDLIGFDKKCLVRPRRLAREKLETEKEHQFTGRNYKDDGKRTEKQPGIKIQNNTKQSNYKQGSTKPSSTKQSSAKQSSAKQSSAKQSSAEQNNIKQSSKRQNSDRPYDSHTPQIRTEKKQSGNNSRYSKGNKPAAKQYSRARNGR
jgi:activator of HSP90 ATPase